MRGTATRRVVLVLLLLLGMFGAATSASAECFKCELIWMVGVVCAHAGPSEAGKDYCSTGSGSCQLSGTPCNQTGGGCGGGSGPCGPKDPTP